MIENLGKNVVSLRNSRDLTRIELSRKLDIDVQTLSRIERGKSKPTFNTLEKIACFFDATPTQLFGTVQEIERERILLETNFYSAKVKNALMGIGQIKVLFVDIFSKFETDFLEKVDSLYASVESGYYDVNEVTSGSFSEILKVERIKKGYSQEELSIKLNVTQGAYASWEIGRTRPNIEKLIEIADILGLSTDYLLGRK